MSILTPTEKTIENRVVKWAKNRQIKVKQKYPAEILDRWFMLPEGFLFIIEFKRKNQGTLSSRQLKEIRILRSLGYDIEVHDDADEAIKAIEIRMEAARLSKEGFEIHARKLIRGSVLGSRTREDKYKPRGDKMPEEGE